ncbi:MAG TPA: HAMP domain-containing sensor histidine kinase [Candidatus Limnocylindria bacterium]|nr:HAMP domain-containing sensor histidine kinase [Candidatus Limnocylindria bacterium]
MTSSQPAVRPGLDAPLLGRVRWRLAAWSAGATLATLIVLGIALYASLNAALSSSSETRLRQQATNTQQLIRRFGDQALPAVLGGQLNDEQHLGTPQFGGPASGTVSILVSPAGQVIGQLPPDLAGDLPVAGSADVARGGATDVRYTTVNDTPVRVLSEPMQVGNQTWVVQILQDRTNEQRVLDTALLVLVIGGLGVLAASVAFGFLYAGRALVPIRESLHRQREFAADASHELRTPIAVIKSSVEDLRRNPQRRVGEVGGALDDVEAEADHLTSLVGDLLLLARADSGVVELHRVPVDLTDAAGEALRSLSHRAEVLKVALRLDASPAPVSGDPDRLRQLLGIVIDNAVQHSPAAATVTVSVRPEARQAVATVDDDGPGIASENIARVFDRFWRAPDAPHQGTGLGLSIARWIAEQHDGSITASNRPGGGARFEIRLPLVPA